jgi:chromosome segregation ATPase
LSEIYLDLTHRKKSRLYGTGSVGESQQSRGSTQSTGASSSLSQDLLRAHLRPLEEQLASERAARELLAQQLAAANQRQADIEAQLSEMRSYMQFPPPPPPPPPTS